MNRYIQVFGNIRMTTAILSLVMVAIIGSIAAVSGAIYLDLHDQALAANKEQQRTNLGTAATILERRLSGSMLNWGEDGTLGSFQSWGIQPFYGTEIIDSVTRVTKQDASIYLLNAAKRSLVSKTTSLMGEDGSRLGEMELDPDSQAYASVMNGESYIGEVTIADAEYLGGLHPIEKTNGDVMGAIFVGTPMRNVEASANSILGSIFTVGGAATLTLSVIGFVLSRLLTRPIPKLAETMGRIAQGDYATKVPYTNFGNEVGAMARAIEVFRESGVRISQMTEAEAARIVAEEVKRQAMMDELQQAFGVVVDAAVGGDFSRLVPVEFPDPQLNTLASSVNRLVSTFDRGVNEIGDVLGAIANTDLTVTVR